MEIFEELSTGAKKSEIRDRITVETASEFTEEEITTACQKLKNSRAPGSDGIRPEVLEALIKECHTLRQYIFAYYRRIFF